MEECPVCLDSICSSKFNLLPCQHKVCQECYPRIRIPICPLCRAPYGDTHQFDYDFDELPIVIEIEYDFLDFLSPRQRRRQRNRRQLQQRPRPRRLTSLEPISIIHIDSSNLIIEDNILPPISPTSPIQNRRYRKKLPQHKRIKQNQKRRNNVSNTYNSLRNQQNFF